MRDRIANALQLAGAVALSAAGFVVSTAFGLAVAGVLLIVAGVVLGVLDRRGR
jgi:hypothetical protein